MAQSFLYRATIIKKDEVIEFADATGDSLQLAQIAADNHEAEYIVFCGVHFMAENGQICCQTRIKASFCQI
ncbi:hypothetical protein BsIDN1_48260 [Bacillus safensis]|uniref:quinolinate synthase n=1 Tax=Bacillus safensis TaxID=561879 RepID=A0A5S9MDY9_BACIA|nr:hypothetical protein BsIDN1_48260 [Bacillus safensis]